MPKPLIKFFKPMNTLLIRRYRRSGGTRGSSQMGFPVVLLCVRRPVQVRRAERALEVVVEQILTGRVREVREVPVRTVLCRVMA
jgi:hypothetical protein